jgi:oligopeptide/dipeptide ABC transporter ATP-binding protein
MTTPGDIVLEVEDLTTEIDAKAGAIRPVDGVSFTVRAGETLGIVGESGSGKSMTGLSILRLVPRPAARITGGSVRLQGEELLTKSEEEMRQIRGKRISMILQDPQTSLNPVFTVGNQLLEALRIHTKDSWRGMRDRAIEALRMVRVAAPEHRVKSFPHQMSGGMRQRVVGAIGISCQPQVIIADEPTTSLDVTIQAQYLRLLQDIQKETGLAIIFITHDFGIVAKLCHRLVVMYAGRVVEEGPVRDIFNHPSHPYTEALLGSVPKLEARSARLPSIDGQPPALWDLPKGCRFAPRCPYAEARCWESYPPSYAGRSGAGEHRASCWRLEDPAWQPMSFSKSVA